MSGLSIEFLSRGTYVQIIDEEPSTLPLSLMRCADTHQRVGIYLSSESATRIDLRWDKVFR